MRLLPYAKPLVEGRRAGRRPWLVVILAGNDAKWRPVMRNIIAPGDAEVPRLWWPDDIPASQADLQPMVGTDVLIADCGCGAQREAELMAEVWARGKPATLWLMRHPDRKWLHLAPAWAKFRAVRVVFSGLRRAPLCVDGIGHPLDQDFKAHLLSWRDTALLCAEGPLFHHPAFADARAQLLAA